MSETVHPKHYTIIRTDIGFGPGRVAAMAAHAAVGWVADRVSDQEDEYVLSSRNLNNLVFSLPEQLWLTRREDSNKRQIAYTEIVLAVPCIHSLQEVYDKAKTAGLVCHKVEEEKVWVALGVGPCWRDEFQYIRENLHLELYP